MATPNVSDDIIFSITRKHNSRRKAYCSYNRATYFTRESGNLTQRDTRKTCGYREKTLGVARVKPGVNQPPTFSLIMKKRGKIRKPNQLRVETDVFMSKKLLVKKQVEAQTKYRLYRGDLSDLALRRIWQIQKIRANYQKFLKKERKLAAQGSDDENDDNDNVDSKPTDDLVEVD